MHESYKVETGRIAAPIFSVRRQSPPKRPIAGLQLFLRPIGTWAVEASLLVTRSLLSAIHGPFRLLTRREQPSSNRAIDLSELFTETRSFQTIESHNSGGREVAILAAIQGATR